VTEDLDSIELDDTDRAILNLIQSDFPIHPRPYQVLGDQLGLSEDQALERVNQLRDAGVIRRVGGNFSSKNLGYSSTLCAAKVPEDKFDEFVTAVNQYKGVTHNYRRDHDYNVWFTFIAPSMEDIEQRLAEIARQTGVSEIYNLPAENTFKIKVDFKFD
jgi:DNA-binding Lrp family transcriptional regulator